MSEIKNFWQNQESPSIDGIVFPNGDIQLINVKVDWGQPVKYKLSLGCKTSIEELKLQNKISWNDCAVITRAIDETKKVEAIAGQGDYGSDGFVAVVNSGNKELVWLAFFETSNPFEYLQFYENELHARSSLGNLWRFPLDEPSRVKVE